MGRGLRLLLTALALAAALMLPRAALASDLALGPLTCTGGAERASTALELPVESLACDAADFDPRERFVRTHSDLSGQFLPPGRALVWQTDPGNFDSMLVRFTYADGSQSLVDVDPQMAARNWFAGNFFSIPVPRSQLPLVAVDTVIERPRTAAIARDARLVSRGDAAHEHLVRAIVYALCCGLFIAAILFDMMLYRVLRARFMVWHIAMTAAMLLFVLVNSGLIFLIFPDLPLAARWRLDVGSLTAAIGFSALFALGLLEPGKVALRLGRILIGTTVLAGVLALLLVADFEPLRLVMMPVYKLGFLPLGLALIAVLAAAAKRRSRAACFVVVGFTGLVATGLFHLGWALGLLPSMLAIDDFLVLSLIVLVVGTSAGVGDRFLVLRAQRDRAREQAWRMGRMAHTDALTGLANRRAFDQIGELPAGQALMLADIDRFKAINDRRGHQVGDTVLYTAAQVLRNAVVGTPGASVFRLGGEEFAIILRAANLDELRVLAESIRAAIEQGDEYEAALNLPSITVSIGATLGRGQALHEAFADADGALFRAKDLGRNRCVVGPIE